jgi:glycosyltransferase involved in cell wall biosynthesis
VRGECGTLKKTCTAVKTLKSDSRNRTVSLAPPGVVADDSDNTLPRRHGKIVHMTSVHSAFDVRIFHRHCKSLARAGHEVVLIAAHPRDTEIDGVRIRAIPEVKNRLLRMTCSVYRIFRQALREQAEVYHFHDPELIAVGALLAGRGKTVIYDVHEDVPADVRYKPYLPAWLRPSLSWFIDRFEKAASHRFSGIISATQPISERFAFSNKNNIVVHNFPMLDDLPLTLVPWKSRKSTIAYVGSITEARGVRELVAAINLVAESFNARLVLAGSFDTGSLMEQVAGLPGWRRVDYLGFVDPCGITKVLSSARIGAVILHPEPNYTRAMPIKLFEYMANGIPVVASDFPLWREMIQDAGCGLMVDPLDPKAIANAIEYLLSHPVEAEAMGCRGREAVERNYNWRSEEEKLLQFYENLLRNNSDPNTAITTSSIEMIQ